MRVNCNTVSLKWTNTVRFYKKKKNDLTLIGYILADSNLLQYRTLPSARDTSHLCFSYYDRTNCVVQNEDHQTAVSWMTFSELKKTSDVIFKDIQPQTKDLGILLTLTSQSSDTDFSSFEQTNMRTTNETKYLVMIILSEIIVIHNISTESSRCLDAQVYYFQFLPLAQTQKPKQNTLPLLCRWHTDVFCNITMVAYKHRLLAPNKSMIECAAISSS